MLYSSYIHRIQRSFFLLFLSFGVYKRDRSEVFKIPFALKNFSAPPFGRGNFDEFY